MENNDIKWHEIINGRDINGKILGEFKDTNERQPV